MDFQKRREFITNPEKTAIFEGRRLLEPPPPLLFADRGFAAVGLYIGCSPAY